MLDFWFGARPWGVRSEWFKKSDAFDAEIRQRFGAAVDAALAGWANNDALQRDAWAAEPLADILLLDQFTRNIHRGTPRAFAGDARALALAQALVASGADRQLHPLQRWFAYLPFEHAEDMRMQDTSLALFGALAAEDQGLAGALDYAERHRAVVARFGRFPHRNSVLAGRAARTNERTFWSPAPGSDAPRAA